jgi:hypothetical protein
MEEESSQTYDFARPVKPALFTLNHSGGYLNASAAKELLSKGKYVEFEVDSIAQAIKMDSHDEPGTGRYKITNPAGVSLQVRSKLVGAGMDYGIYLHVGGSVFRHVNQFAE